MKKFNIKTFVIDHAEKIVFGFFAMIVLCILGMGTSWSSFEKSPDELKSSIEKVRSKFMSADNIWPKAKEDSFKVIEFSEKAKMLYAAPQIARYDFSIPLFYPLYRKDEPKREPSFEPVLWLSAKAGFAPIPVLSDEELKLRSEEAEMTEPAPEMSKPGDAGEFEFRAKPAAGGPAGTPGMAAGRPPTGPPAVSPGGGKSKGSSGVLMPPGMSGMSGMSSMMPGMSGPPGSSAPAVPGSSVRGVRFVAVRGVFPLKKQIDDYAKALHQPTAEVQDLFEITDFVLERQTAKAGLQPWSDSKWEAVDISSAIALLDECKDLDSEDPVPTAMRDPVITMNLPMNLLGRWKDYATHPKIKDDELSAEEIEMENKLLMGLDSAMTDAKLAEPTKATRKGLSVVQRDIKAVASQVGRNDTSRNSMDKYMKSMGSSMGSSSMPMPPISMGPPGMMAGMRGTPMDKLTSRKPYILFRYFDFDVQPGMAYRYRVRLKLKNPNFERSAEELAGADPEIAKGEERETPWSNTSNPDIVRMTTNYFLKDVEREPYNDDKVKPNRPIATLSMYEWDTKIGAVVSDSLTMRAIGEFIGEEKKDTLIPDLIAGTLEKVKKHLFMTQDVLLDLEPDVRIPSDQHPDLKLMTEKGHADALIGLPEVALVVNSFGELKTLGSPMKEHEADEAKYWKGREDFERKMIKDKAKEAAPAGNPMDALMRQQSGSDPSMGSSGFGSGAPPGSPLRRGRGRRPPG